MFINHKKIFDKVIFIGSLLANCIFYLLILTIATSYQTAGQRMYRIDDLRGLMLFISSIAIFLLTLFSVAHLIGLKKGGVVIEKKIYYSLFINFCTLFLMIIFLIIK